MNWDQLRDTDELEFALTDDASTEWATAAGDRPAAPCSSVAEVVPPSVEISVDESWSSDPVEVTITPSVEESEGAAPLAVAEIEWRLDGGEWTTYSGPFEVSDEGDHLLEARGIDDDGTASEVVSARVRVDATAPVTALDQERDGEAVVVTFAAEDPLSGVARTEYRLEGGSWQTVDGAVRIADGATSAIEFRSTDVAGNQEPIRVAALLAAPGPGGDGAGGGDDAAAGGGLAQTATEVATWIALAGLLIAAGIGLAIARRRRGPAAD